MRELAALRPRRVLDAGCGTGDITERVRAAVDPGWVVGIDLSPRMVTLTRDRGVPALVADLDELPFSDSWFDAVLANRVLYHLPDPGRGIASLRRVVRQGGTLVVVLYRRCHLSELWEQLRRPLWGPDDVVAETGEVLLRAQFSDVERIDITQAVTWSHRADLEAYLSSYESFAGQDLAALLPEVPLPFHGTGAYGILVGR